MVSVQVRGYYKPNGTNAGDVVFWSLVYDRQTNGVVPAWTDVYTLDSISHQIRNLDNRKRFTILGSGYIPIPKAGADIPIIPFEYFKRIEFMTEYNATNGGTVADITTGGLFWMHRGGSAAGDNDVTADLAARLKYTDV